MNPSISRRRHEKASRARDERAEHESPDCCRTGHAQVNVGDAERQLSLLGGTVLAVCGLLRGSLSGLALAAIGGGLVWRGYTGHCELYHMLGHSTSDDREVGRMESRNPVPEQFETHLHGYESHAAGEV